MKSKKLDIKVFIYEETFWINFLNYIKDQSANSKNFFSFVTQYLYNSPHQKLINDLFGLIEQNKIDLKFKLNSNTYVNVKNSSLIHKIFEICDERTIGYLINTYNFDLDAVSFSRDNNDKLIIESPIYVAIKRDMLSTIKLLVENKKVDINLQKNDKRYPSLRRYPLDYAALFGSTEVLSYLLSKTNKEIIIHKTLYDGPNAFRSVIYSNNLDKIKLFIKFVKDHNLLGELLLNNQNVLFDAIETLNIDTIKKVTSIQPSMRIYYISESIASILSNTNHAQSLEVFKFLFANIFNSVISNTLLSDVISNSAKNNRLDVLEFLLSQNLDDNNLSAAFRKSFEELISNPEALKILIKNNNNYINNLPEYLEIAKKHEREAIFFKSKNLDKISQSVDILQEAVNENLARINIKRKI